MKTWNIRARELAKRVIYKSRKKKNGKHVTLAVIELPGHVHNSNDIGKVYIHGRDARLRTEVERGETLTFSIEFRCGGTSIRPEANYNGKYTILLYTETHS